MSEETKRVGRSRLRIVSFAMGLAALIISVLIIIGILVADRVAPVIDYNQVLAYIVLFGSFFLAAIALVFGVIGVLWKTSPKLVPIFGIALSAFLILASIWWWFGVIGPNLEF